MQHSTEVFLGLPDGIWTDYIFPHFSQQELMNAALLSKKAYSLVRSPNLWKELVVYENRHDTYASSRSITHFDLLTRKFTKLERINVYLGKMWSSSIRNIPPDRYGDWILALRSLFSPGDRQIGNLRKLRLDFNHHGSVISREDCERFFSELQEYSRQFHLYIQDVTLKEICHHQCHIHVRWWNWLEDFLVLAPRFWSSVEKLDIGDTTLNNSRSGQTYQTPIIFRRIVKHCPRLKVLAITTWSSCDQEAIIRMLKIIEGSDIVEFELKTGYTSKSFTHFRSLSHQIDVKYVFAEDRLHMSIIKK